jgi:transketolase
MKVTEQNIKEWSGQTFRTMFTKAITSIAAENPDVVLMVADLGRAMGASGFAESYPERYLQCGIAEQNLIGMAAGLASGGKIPYLTSFAPFATMRCCEQIRVDLAYNDLPVKIIGSESGVSMGVLGTTHFALEDIGVLRSISNLVIISPADGLELVKTMYAVLKLKGPVYIRLGGGKSIPMVYKEDYNFTIGKAVTLKEGTDGTLIATGTMVNKAMEAAESLLKDNLHFGVMNIHTIKPIDEEAIVKAAIETKNIITIEEHNIIGGLGSAVGDVMAQHGVGKLLKIGLPDEFPKTIASYPELLERYGLTSQNIKEKVINLMK